MIDDSYVWKERLRRERTAFRKAQRRVQRRETDVEKALVAVEVLVFLTGYVVRKLIDARKLSDELETSLMDLCGYPATGYPLDHLNAHHVERAYDFSRRSAETLSLVQLCNLLVHSFIFSPVMSDDTLTCVGFLVNSDWTKDKQVYEVALSDFDVLVDEVIRDDIVASTFARRTGTLWKSRVGIPGRVRPIKLNAPAHRR